MKLVNSKTKGRVMEAGSQKPVRPFDLGFHPVSMGLVPSPLLIGGLSLVALASVAIGCFVAREQLRFLESTGPAQVQIQENPVQVQVDAVQTTVFEETFYDPDMECFLTWSLVCDEAGNQMGGVHSANLSEDEQLDLLLDLFESAIQQGLPTKIGAKEVRRLFEAGRLSEEQALMWCREYHDSPLDVIGRDVCPWDLNCQEGQNCTGEVHQNSTIEPADSPTEDCLSYSCPCCSGQEFPQGVEMAGCPECQGADLVEVDKEHKAFCWHCRTLAHPLLSGLDGEYRCSNCGRDVGMLFPEGAFVSTCEFCGTPWPDEVQPYCLSCGSMSPGLSAKDEWYMQTSWDEDRDPNLVELPEGGGWYQYCPVDGTYIDRTQALCPECGRPAAILGATDETHTAFATCAGCGKFIQEGKCLCRECQQLMDRACGVCGVAMRSLDPTTDLCISCQEASAARLSLSEADESDKVPSIDELGVERVCLNCGGELGLSNIVVCPHCTAPIPDLDEWAWQMGLALMGADE